MALPSWIGTGRAIPFGPGALPFYNNLNPGQQVTKQYLQQTVPTWNLPEGVKEPPVAPFDWQAFYKEQDEARKRGIEIEPPMIAFKTPEPGRTTMPAITPSTPAITGPSPAGGTMNLSGDVMAPREATEYPNNQQYAQYLPNYTMGQAASPLAQVYANRYRMNATPFPNYYTGRTNPFQNRRSMF